MLSEEVKRFTELSGEDGYATSIERIGAWLDGYDKAKAEIVIRCKECKYWQKEHLCNHWSRYGTIETGAYDYCSNGRKKC